MRSGACRLPSSRPGQARPRACRPVRRRPRLHALAARQTGTAGRRRWGRCRCLARTTPRCDQSSPPVALSLPTGYTGSLASRLASARWGMRRRARAGGPRSRRRPCRGKRRAPPLCAVAPVDGEEEEAPAEPPRGGDDVGVVRGAAPREGADVERPASRPSRVDVVELAPARPQAASARVGPRGAPRLPPAVARGAGPKAGEDKARARVVAQQGGREAPPRVVAKLRALAEDGAEGAVFRGGARLDAR
mmetsp:Transcript_47253/g.153361  ORF Transcript_47253/g.153361 Transcript_47253/m.153361 type:complete len:248 (+) Transcript_47253:224-967(+)